MNLQQNSPVEIGFAFTLNKAKSIMIGANVPHLVRHKIMQESIITATTLGGLVTTTIKGKEATRYEHFGLPLPTFICCVRTWGNAGVIKTKPPNAPKLTNKGSSCMFVGNADEHNGD